MFYICSFLRKCKARFLAGGQSGIEDPHAGFYIKTQTSLSEEMCPALCDDGEAASELVELALKQMVKGTVTEKQVNSRLQTRLK